MYSLRTPSKAHGYRAWTSRIKCYLDLSHSRSWLVGSRTRCYLLCLGTGGLVGRTVCAALGCVLFVWINRTATSTCDQDDHTLPLSLSDSCLVILASFTLTQACTWHIALGIVGR
jgi:hypothetical protein